MAERSNYVEMTAEIVAAFVSNSTVSVAELPELIRQVHKALGEIATGPAARPAPAAAPAVSARKSITPDYLVCLEDGRKFKSLKRHLRTTYNLSPEQYRAKWKLPHDYPMVAPNYAAARSAVAKESGLGRSVRPVAARISAVDRGEAGG